MRKIIIIPPNEVKARLSEYMDPDDFPKRYGGNLDWEFGMPPHLDQPAREEVERNGSKGWIEGPCLWEQNQRVPVGTVGGKPRRPAELVPVPARTVAVSNIARTGPTMKPATPVEAPASSAKSAPLEAAESSNPPSMAHSGSAASTFVSGSTETVTTAPAIGPPKVLESEAPLVANGQVLRAGDVKPPIERFVTAAEDLHTTRTQVNGVA